MNFNTEHDDAMFDANDDIHDVREAFAIRSTIIANELRTMIEKTKRIENLIRSQMGLPMTIEILFDMTYNAFQSYNEIRDPLAPPPKKRTKYE
jgi:hypothetical protein